MGVFDDIEAQESESVLERGLEMSRLIREEVRAVMREQTFTATSSEPAPPSYDSSAGLLATDSAEPHDNALDPTELSSRVTPAAKEGRLRWINQLPKSIRLLILIAPLLAVPISLPVVSLKGYDPLELSITAFFQLLGAFMIAVFLFVPVAISIDSKESGDPPDDSPTGFLLTGFLTYHFFFTYLFFILILWWRFASGENWILSRLQVAERFDAKFDDNDALARMTECLYNNLPDRNATIKDVEVCLMKLGMPLIY